MLQNIDDVIHAHVKWKVTLRTAINQRAVPEKDPSDHTACALGQWLKTEGAAHVELAQAHKEFHQLAARIISMVKVDPVVASTLLDGEFTQKSLKVVGFLTRLKTQKAA